MATFVLVHGGWHGGWCWSRVADRLRPEHVVHTPTLTGLSELAHVARENIDLDTHIADVVGLIEGEHLTDVVLSGHSYAGMVVTGVADRIPDRIAALVYLDSFVPNNGDSVRSLTGWPDPTEPTVPPPPAESLGLTGADAEWVNARMTPHPSGCVTQRIALARPPATGIPATYILATDRTSRVTHLKERYEQALITPGWTGRTIHGSHELMIDHPDEVAAELVAAVTRR